RCRDEFDEDASSGEGQREVTSRSRLSGCNDKTVIDTLNWVPRASDSVNGTNAFADRNIVQHRRWSTSQVRNSTSVVDGACCWRWLEAAPQGRVSLHTALRVGKHRWRGRRHQHSVSVHLIGQE